MIENLFPNVDWAKMWEATLETLYMTAISTLFTFVIGLSSWCCIISYGSWSIMVK